MARKRMIDPNIWESQSFNRLSMMARMLFIGLFSNADDEGRGVAHPARIRSTIFPYDDMPIDTIISAMDECAAQVSVTFYEVDGDQFYQLENWLKWQRIDRPTPSIYPPLHTIDDDSSNARRTLDEQSRPKEKKEREVKRSKENEEDEEDACAPAREDEPPVDIVAYCQANFPAMSSANFEELRDFMSNGISSDMVMYAVDEARAHGSIAWSYARSMMDNWIMAGIKTVDAAKTQSAIHRTKKQAKQGAPPGNASAGKMTPNVGDKDKYGQVWNGRMWVLDDDHERVCGRVSAAIQGEGR